MYSVTFGLNSYFFRSLTLAGKIFLPFIHFF